MLVGATSLLATHCPDDPDCGHEGGTCDPEVVCAYFPDLVPGSEWVCVKSAAGRGGGGGGGGTPPTPVPTLTPTFRENLVGEYSWNSSAVYCDARDDDAHEIDPITVVARLHWHPEFFGTYSLEWEWESASWHLDHHGWGTQRDTGQYFRQNNGCVEGSISLADVDYLGSGIEQWHARGHTQVGVQDPFHQRRPDEELGATVTAMTPHYDEATHDAFPPYNRCSFIDHCVEQDYDPGPAVFSGFDRGREELAGDWLASPHHTAVESAFWNNRHVQIQCNDDETASNGYVYHLGLCEVSYPC